MLSSVSIFLKYISDAFEEQHAKLIADKADGADPEDRDEYRALSISWVPPGARWAHLNISDWGDERLAGDQRWQYGAPPARRRAPDDARAIGRGIA